MAKSRRSLFVFLSLAAALSGGYGSALFGVCGPFTDVAADSFCPFVLEIFTIGITTGFTPTTYDPSSNVNRLQMAVFLSRTVDRILQRGNRRAALNQFWTPQNLSAVLEVNLGSATNAGPALLQSDGADIWVANNLTSSVARVRGSDGKILETITGTTAAYGVLNSGGQIWITAKVSGEFGSLYRIPATGGGNQVYGGYTGDTPVQAAFDGLFVWTANFGGSVSHFDPTNLGAIPLIVKTGFAAPFGILYDGSNIWVTDIVARTLLKLDANAAILQTVTVGLSPRFPVFDGANIWVPNFNSNSVSVVRASTGTVLATLTGNGLNGPVAAAFDGERTAVTNFSGDSVSLWKAADLTTIGSLALAPGSQPNGICSDGLNFWVALYGTAKLARF